MSTATIDINCDLGEGYGRWRFAPDEEFMPYISTANIACGFHAGDPRIMRESVRMALDHGLQIGAHVALPDLLGFGRRRMAVSPEELRDYTVYQVGALKAFVEARGHRLGHVKPHGVMYVMSAEDAELGEAVIAAVAEIDPGMLLYSLDERHAPIAERYGVTLVREGFVDLAYDGAGNLLIERVKEAWDPELVAARAIRFVREGKVETTAGTDLVFQPPSICLHGDAPNSVEVIRTVRQRLDGAEIAVRCLKHDDVAA
jgi:UPF0271 protein